MTSKLKCPFCEYELQENGTMNLCCPICGLVAPTKLWQALIQAKQDLEKARKALKEIEWFCYAPTMWERAGRMQQCAAKALETIGKHNE